MYFPIGTPKVYKAGKDKVVAVSTSPRGSAIAVLTERYVQLWSAGQHRMRIGQEALATDREGPPTGMLWRDDGLALCVYTAQGTFTSFEIGLALSGSDASGHPADPQLEIGPVVSYPAAVGAEVSEDKEATISIGRAKFVGKSTLRVPRFGAVLAVCNDDEALYVSTERGDFLTILWKFVGPPSMLTALASSMGFAYGKGDGGEGRCFCDPAPLALVSAVRVTSIVGSLTPPPLPTPPTPSLLPVDMGSSDNLGESVTSGTAALPLPTSFASLSVLRRGHFIGTVTDTGVLCVFNISSYSFDSRAPPPDPPLTPSSPGSQDSRRGAGQGASTIPPIFISAPSARECAHHIIKQVPSRATLPAGVEHLCTVSVKGCCSAGLKGLHGKRHIATLNRKRGLLAVSYGGRVILHDVNLPVHKSAHLSMEPWGYRTADLGHVTEMLWSPDQEALAVVYAKRGFSLFHWSGASLMTTLQRNASMEGPAMGGLPGGGGSLSRYSTSSFSCVAFGQDAFHIFLGFGSRFLQVELARSMSPTSPACTRGPHVTLSTWNGILMFRHPDLDVLKDNWDTLYPPECYTTAYGPMRFQAFSEDGQHCVVSGVRGCALYNARLKRWRLWAVQEQESELEVVAPPAWVSNVAVCLPARDVSAKAGAARAFPTTPARQHATPAQASSPVHVDPQQHPASGGRSGLSQAATPRKSMLKGGLKAGEGGGVGTSPSAAVTNNTSSSSIGSAAAAGGSTPQHTPLQQPQGVPRAVASAAAFSPSHFPNHEYYRGFHGNRCADLPDRDSYLRLSSAQPQLPEDVVPPPPLCQDANHIPASCETPQRGRQAQGSGRHFPAPGGGAAAAAPQAPPPQRVAYCLLFYPRLHLDRGSLLLKIPLDYKPVLVDSAVCRQTGDDGCYSLVVLDEIGKVICFRLAVSVDSVTKPSKVSVRLQSKRIVNIETTSYIVMLRVLPSPQRSQQVQNVNERASSTGVSLPAVVLLTQSGDLEVVSFALRTRSVLARSVTCAWLDPVLNEYGFVHVVVSSPKKNTLVGFLHPHHKRDGATCVALRRDKNLSNMVPGPPHITTLLQDADADALPVGVLAKEGLLVSATEGVRAAAAGLLPEYHVHVRTIPYLHTVLLSLFIGLASTEDPAELASCHAAATALARTLHEHSFFVDVMDYLVHSVLYLHDVVETRLHNVERSAVLREVLRFLSHYPEFFAILVHSLRKADPGMWSLIFTHCPPLNIFRGALCSGRIQESAMLLRVLQMPLHDDPATELRVAAAAANKLFPLAVSSHNFELSAELLRFLTLLSGEIRCSIPEEEDVMGEAVAMLSQGRVRDLATMTELLGIDCAAFLRSHALRPEGTAWVEGVLAELHRQFSLPCAGYAASTAARHTHDAAPPHGSSPDATVVAARVSAYNRVLSQWRRGGSAREAADVALHAALLGFITPAQVHLLLVPPSLKALCQVAAIVKSAGCTHLSLLLSIMLLDLAAVRQLLAEDASLDEVLKAACMAPTHAGYKPFLQAARKAVL